MANLDAIYEDALAKLEERLTQYRLIHSLSTSDIATLLAEVYDVNPDHARLAGLLHDWDKAYSNEELLARAQRYGIDMGCEQKKLIPLLHAETGACAVQEEYPNLPQEITQAIARHTSAALDMSPSDMVVYIADMIEPLRTASHLAWLRRLAGNVSLEELFAACYRETVERLIRRRRHLHPGTAEIWNTYVATAHEAETSGFSNKV